MNLREIGVRLRALEKKKKLEKLLAPSEEGLPWSEVLAILVFLGTIGLAIHMVRMGMAAVEAKQPPSGEDLLWMVCFALVVVSLRVARLFARTRSERLRIKVRRHGLVVPAAIVQANDGFFDPDNDQWWPASVLLSFDPKVMDQPELLARVARRVAALKRMDRRTLPAGQALVAWDLYHEMGPLPSVPVPEDLTEGLRDCIVATVMLPPQPLREGPLLVCLAVPGQASSSAVAVVPASVMS